MSNENALAGGTQVASQHGNGESGGTTTPEPTPAAKEGEVTAPANQVLTTENQTEGSPWDKWNMTSEKGAEAYSSLQGEYTKVNTEHKELMTEMERFGGWENVQKTAEFLQSDPQFIEWYQQRLAADASGVGNATDMDDEQMRAIKTVENLIDQKLRNEYEPKVERLETELNQRTLLENVNTVRDKFKDFDDYKETMADISKRLHPDMQATATAEQIEDLYWSAIRESGKMEEKMAQLYQAQLEAKKAQDTGAASGVATTTSNAKVMNIADAFTLAKKTLNL